MSSAECCGDKKCNTESQCDQCTFKLHYFAGRGRGEPIRWILHFAKVPFEDVRYTMEEWQAKKAEINSPSGQIPFIECVDKKSGNAKRMVQSAAICRTLACKFNLAGKTSCEHAACDEVVEMLRDAIEAGYRAMFEKDEKRKEELTNQLKNETGPRVFGFLEKKLNENGGKHLVGDCWTYADILVAQQLDSIKQHKTKEEMEALEKHYPKLAALAHAVADMPQIKAWLDKRPASHF